MVQKAWEFLHWKTSLKSLFQSDDKTTLYTLCNSRLISSSRHFPLPYPIVLLPSWPWKPSSRDRQPAICPCPALHHMFCRTPDLHPAVKLV